MRKKYSKLIFFIIGIIALLYIIYVGSKIYSRNIDKKEIGIPLGLAEIQGSRLSAYDSVSGNFILYKKQNKLYFRISYLPNGKETNASIEFNDKKNNQVLFILPNENIKIGVWNYDEEDEKKILSGSTYVKIYTKENPEGEIIGEIKVVPESCEL